MTSTEARTSSEKCNFAFLQSFFNYSVIMLEKCALTIVELNLNQRLGHNRTKLSNCHHMLTSSTQLQNRSIHVVEKTRTSSKCQKMKNARAKRAKILFFVVKYANLCGFCCCRRRGCLRSPLSSLGSLSVGACNSHTKPMSRHFYRLIYF